ncbi:DUF3492 domain-containing protein [uncultured Streptomyces sp.]|uniref:DUF3492 domain-containing protein n=1 Tax=uncultured Streptomyces sp. TaxID=174707 RepID=UPI002601F9C0|nr:DUF3492 domain-containing protein [uncultured Streptomyces sp.]
MRIGLLTDGGYPYANGESRLWCDRLVRGLPQHEFDLFALSRSAEQEDLGRVLLPPQVREVYTAPLWDSEEDVLRGGEGGCGLTRLVTGGAGAYGRRERRRFTAHLTELCTAVCASEEDAARTAGLFTRGLYGLAELAREHGGLHTALRSEATVRILEAACRARGTARTVQRATVADQLAFAAELERLLRPLSLDWYDDDTLGSVDLCHAASGGAAALPGLLAKRFFGTPLLVTEHTVPLRTHYLSAPDGAGAPARALLARLHARLAAEVYRQAAVITPGNTHVRRWQERCGADPGRVRTVYPGMEAARFAGVGEGPQDDGAGPGTLVWVGRIEPAKDLIGLLHAFAEVHRAEPDARLRVFGAPADGPEGAAYLGHCRALAARLLPDEADGAHAEGDSPVSFEEIGGPEAHDLAEAYAAGGIVVLSSVVEGFPISLVEAMFCGRATVSTDVGAVVEVIGGTGLVVPARNPKALADACLALLGDPERRARLGAAARARAVELFTVEQNLAAYRSIYLELLARSPGRVARAARYDDRDTRPFATPPEAHVLGERTGGARTPQPAGRAAVPDAGPVEERWVPAAATAPGAHASAESAGARAGRVPRWAQVPEGACAGAGDGDA